MSNGIVERIILTSYNQLWRPVRGHLTTVGNVRYKVKDAPDESAVTRLKMPDGSDSGLIQIVVTGVPELLWADHGLL